MRRLIALFLCFGTLYTEAQSKYQTLDSLFLRLDQHHKVMCSAALTEEGRVVYHKSIGFQHVPTKTYSNDKTLYHIGSLSKMFTATLVMQLVEEGKLTLDTKLSDFYPTIKNANRITIKQLLNHSSGIFSFTSDSTYQDFYQSAQTDQQLLTRFAALPSEFEPGTKHEYSNTGYVLLSMIIEKKTGLSYNDVLQKRICKPLNLKYTKIGSTLSPSSGMAYSYLWEGGAWKAESETHPSIPKGAGAIVSTPEEICAFLHGLFQWKLLPQPAVERMMKQEQDHGLGLFEFPFGKRTCYGHTGSIDAFEAMAGYFPTEKKAICILANGVNYDINQIGLGMLSVLFETPYTLPSFEKKINPATSNLVMGKYRNEKIGMTIQIFEENGTLKAQAEGQNAFPLTTMKEDRYEFKVAGIELQFNRNSKNEVISATLLQGGELEFERIE